MQLVRVALDVPLARFFDYLVPPGETLTASDVGRRVRVPFGTRMRIGIVVDLPELGGSQRLVDSGLPLFTLVDFEGH